MVKVLFAIRKAHIAALERLIDCLDYEIIRRCAESDQECYDVVYSLNRLREGLKQMRLAAPDSSEWSDPLKPDR